METPSINGWLGSIPISGNLHMDIFDNLTCVFFVKTIDFQILGMVIDSGDGHAMSIHKFQLFWSTNFGAEAGGAGQTMSNPREALVKVCGMVVEYGMRWQCWFHIFWHSWHGSCEILLDIYVHLCGMRIRTNPAHDCFLFWVDVGKYSKPMADWGFLKGSQTMR